MSTESNRVGLYISVISLFLSAAVSYLTLLRNVSVEMQMGSDMFVSNTMGGIPDAVLDVRFAAVGPPSRTATIQRVTLDLFNRTTNQLIQLEALRSASGPELPAIVLGGSTVALKLLLETNDDLPKEIERTEKWFAELETVVDEARKHEAKQLKRARLEELYGSDLERDPSETDSPISRSAMNRRIAQVLAGVETRNLGEILFISPGSYEATLKALDESGNTVATVKRTFSVNETLAKALRRKFNTNIRVTFATESEQGI